jgi:hypothetical protein
MRVSALSSARGLLRNSAIMTNLTELLSEIGAIVEPRRLRGPKIDTSATALGYPSKQQGWLPNSLS